MRAPRRDGRPQICPWCEVTLTIAVPPYGDAVVCYRCAEVGILMPAGYLRRAAPAEIDDELRAIQATMRASRS